MKLNKLYNLYVEYLKEKDLYEFALSIDCETRDYTKQKVNDAYKSLSLMLKQEKMTYNDFTKMLKEKQ